MSTTESTDSPELTEFLTALDLTPTGDGEWAGTNMADGHGVTLHVGPMHAGRSFARVAVSTVLIHLHRESTVPGTTGLLGRGVAAMQHQVPRLAPPEISRSVRANGCLPGPVSAAVPDL